MARTESINWLYDMIRRYLITEPNGQDRSIVTAGKVRFYVPGLDWPLELSKGVSWARSICQVLDWCPRRVLVMREYEKDPESGLFLKMSYNPRVSGFKQMREEIYQTVHELNIRAIGSEIASQEKYRWIVWDKLQAGQFNNTTKTVWSLPFVLEKCVT